MNAINDVKESFRLLRGKFLSYLLAIVGMMFVLLVLFVIITVPIGILMWVLGFGPSSANFIDVWVNDVLLFWQPLASTSPIAQLGVVFIFVVLPVFALLEWVLGSVYGMSKDIVTSGESSAEGAFSWFRKMAPRFLLSGIVIATIVIGPVGIASYLISWYYGFSTPWQVTWPLLIILVLYLYLFLGLLRMYIPAVADGMGVVDGLRKALSLIRNNIGRVFGAWTIYFILIFIWFVPLGIWGVLQGVPGPWPGALSLEFWLSLALAGIGLFLDLLIFFPMMILGMTKIYTDIKGQ